MVTVAIEMNANGTTTNSNMAASDQQQDNPQQQHPDAKLIGREFVRQYYTMLAEHPHYVHRFYSQDSIFIHCASDPIVGQTNIQKKIQELSLEQCKAKIRKVDACEAPKKGVVIQVLGELSCKGDPGRRFHQTFVLAPQTSKKYYVFNDIFQYAEEVFKPEDPQNSVAGHQEVHGTAADVTHSEASESLQNGAVTQEETSRLPMQSPAGPGGSGFISSQQAQQPPPLPQRERADSSTYSVRQTPAEVGGVVPVEPPPPPPQQYNRERTGSSQSSGFQIQPPPPEPSPTGVVEQSPPVPAQEQVVEPPQPLPPQEPEEQGPKTWARIAGRNSAAAAIITTTQTVPPPQPPVQSQNETDVVVQQNQAPQQVRTAVQHGLNQPQQQRPHVNFRGGRDLFVGNLPPDVDERSLQQFFTAYGNVIHVRIPRQGLFYDNKPKQPIAFISFDDPSAVKKVLDTALTSSGNQGRPGKLQMVFENVPCGKPGWLINVEEKKDRAEEGRGGGQFYQGDGVYRNTGGGEWQGGRRQGQRGGATGGGRGGRGAGGPRTGMRDDRGRQARNIPRQQPNY